MKTYSKQDKYNYYSSRMTNKKLTQGQREFARKRSNQIHQEMMKKTFPVMKNKIGGEVGMLFTIQEWFARVTQRKVRFLSTRITEDKKKHIDELNKFQSDLENLMIKNKYSDKQKVYVIAK